MERNSTQPFESIADKDRTVHALRSISQPAIPLQALPRQPSARPVVRARTPGYAENSTFERINSKPPGIATWRGPADSEIGRTVARMLKNLQAYDGPKIKGDTPESLFRRSILDNRRISNEQLLAMRNVTLDQIADSPKAKAKVYKKVPNVRDLPVHKFTVALMSAATGIDADRLSEATPSLGLTGATNTPILYAAKSERVQRSTALHDFTDYLRGAGVKGINKAVWGVENRVLSALVSFFGGGRY